jgi:DNA-binding transcriptional ArsR family regulator
LDDAIVAHATEPPGLTRPDYDLERGLDVDTPQQLKAIGDETRSDILSLLNERAATVSQLADTLGRPKGSVGHHVKVLEDAGLVRVVRTRQVPATTEKYYGRTARTFFIKTDVHDEGEKFAFLRQAMSECRLPSGDEAEELPISFTIRHARIPDDRAAEFLARILEVAEEFTAQEPGGETVYGLLAGVYPTERPSLGPDEEEAIA